MGKFTLFILFSSVSLLAQLSFANTGPTQELRTGENTDSAKNLDRSLCEYGGRGVIRKRQPSGSPNYFFRTFNRGGKEFVSYASSQGGLAILDLKTGKETRFYGDYDPVPLNADIMSTPPQNETMTFYSTEEILKGKTKPKRIVPKNDKPLEGVYQSVGELPPARGKKVYRMITDAGGASAAEYAVAGKTIEMTKAPSIICSNVDFKLPMLSKNGKLMSGYDVRKGTTKIWSLKNDGTCEEVFDLGVGAGKADFSYDNNQITFHTTSAGDPTKYFQTPNGSNMNMNVFVYDLKKKTLKKMSQNRVEDSSYYPVFRPDGTIVYSQVGNNENPQFIQADPKKVSGISYDPKTVTPNSNRSLFWIGTRWGERCLGGEVSPSTAIATAMTLKPDTCKKVIEEAWEDYKHEISDNPDITKATLLKSCPGGTSSLQDIAGEKVKEEDNHAAMAHLSTGEKILATKCAICHQQFGASNLKGTPVSKELAAKVMKRINGENGLLQMPPGGGISEDERNLVRGFVQGLKPN